MRVQGIVVSVHGTYSFARILDGYPCEGSEIFAHHEHITWGHSGKRSLCVGMTIDFELSTKNGRPYAKLIRLVSMPTAAPVAPTVTSKQETLSNMKEEPNGNR